MPTSDHTLAPGQEFDGYQIIRFLGRGGFGEVWLCRSEVMNGYHALKFIAGANADLLKKEFQALALYRKEASKLRSPNLVPIEHINRYEARLFYVMPLADGITETDPADANWQPLSLADTIHARISSPAWFSSGEILNLMQPLLLALQTLSDAGLVHRDVKPENILFFNGAPCLGDISLLGEDSSVITRRGTPGYATPSWYLGGLPDMYGAAATLYSLLTGNQPDKMGRSAFIWPPHGEASLSEAERSEWKRLHAVIRRATEEKVAERFIDFRAMALALKPAPHPHTSPGFPASSKIRMNIAALPTKKKSAPSWILRIGSVIILLQVLLIVVVAFSATDTSTEQTPKTPPRSSKEDQTLPISSASPSQDHSVTLEESAENIDSAFRDANIADYGLGSVRFDSDSIPTEHIGLFQNALNQISINVRHEESFDPVRALRHLDLCLEVCEHYRRLPNVKLARLLLLRATGDSSTIASELENPIYLTLGEDNLSARVAMLSQLGADEMTETLLDNLLADSSLTPRIKSQALLLRAEHHLKLDRLADADRDAEKAIAAVSDNPERKVGLVMDILNLQSKYPAFAEFLEPEPEK